MANHQPYKIPPDARRCRKEAMRFLDAGHEPVNGIDLFQNFTETMGRMCRDYCYWFPLKEKFFAYAEEKCRECPLKGFGKTLKEYCDRMEDDGR